MSEVEQCLEEASRLGLTIAVRDDKLLVSRGVPPELRMKILGFKSELIQFLKLRQKALSSQERVDRVHEMRRFMPGLLRSVQLSDGRDGILWGLSVRGVMVSTAPDGVILTVEPKDVVVTEDV